jgi:hypothetical protein
MSECKELVDLCFSLVLAVSSPEHAVPFSQKSVTERAAWVAEKLREFGYPTVPCGASWSLLVEDQKESEEAWKAELDKSRQG